jgi:hypothetical protein
VGLRWCGGWRCANLGGAHDQAQIKANGCYPRCRAKDGQARIAQATRINIEANNAVQYQAGPYHRDVANACGRNDCVPRDSNTVAAAFGPRIPCRCSPQEAWLNLVSEIGDKGRVYRIKDGKASPSALDRAKQAG